MFSICWFHSMRGDPMPELHLTGAANAQMETR